MTTDVVEQTYTLAWERINYNDIVSALPHCYGCGDYFLNGERCAALHMEHETVIRFHKNCLEQLATLFISFLQAIEGEGKPN